MKKLLFVIVFIIGFSDAFGQSMLRVRLADNSRFNVSVNGRYFNKRGKSVTVGDLPTGRHLLKIYSIAYDRWGKPYDKLVYQGMVRTYWGTLTYFSFDPHTRRITTQQELYNDADKYDVDEATDVDTRSEDGYRRQEYTKDRQYEPVNRQYESPEENREDARAETPVARPVVVSSFSPREEERLKSRVDMRETDTDKLKVIKSGLKRESVSTYQVGMIMDWLLFESTRVEFAKWVYDSVVDKLSFPDLFEKLDYSSSKEELKKYINSRK